MPEPIIEDWSFHELGEYYLLRHLFKNESITTRSEYNKLRRQWMDDANKVGSYALRHDPRLFRNYPVTDSEMVGSDLIDLGLVAFDGNSTSDILFRSNGDWLPLKLTKNGKCLARLLFNNPPAIHRALLLLFYTTENLAYFAACSGNARVSFFAGLIGLDIYKTRDYFQWLVKRKWTDIEFPLDYYNKNIPILTEIGVTEAEKILQEKSEETLYNPKGEAKEYKTGISSATELYGEIKNLIEKTTPLDEITAKRIIELVDDTLKEFGSTNQAKKVELRDWRQRAERVLPPKNASEFLDKTANYFLDKFFPTRPRLRNALFWLIGIGFIISLAAGVYKFLLETSNKQNSNSANTNASPSASVAPSSTIPSGYVNSGNTENSNRLEKSEPESTNTKSLPQNSPVR